MCEFCESGKKQLLQYDNRGQMSISFGQYKGVCTEARIELEGNMLSLSSTGNYRSDFDCYYESVCADDFDGENSKNDKCSILKLSYCPFCGRKLTEGVYEVENAKRRIKELDDAIWACDNVLKQNFNLCFFEFTRTGVTAYDHDESWRWATPKDDDKLKLCIYGAIPPLWVETSKEVNQKYHSFIRLYIDRDNINPFEESELAKDFKSNSFFYGKVTYHSKFYTITDDEILKYLKQGLVCGLDLNMNRKKMTLKTFKELVQSKEHVEMLITKFKKEREECENILKFYTK